MRKLLPRLRNRPLKLPRKKGMRRTSQTCRVFFIQGRFGSVWEHEESPPPAVHLQSVPERKNIKRSPAERGKAHRSQAFRTDLLTSKQPKPTSPATQYSRHYSSVHPSTGESAKGLRFCLEYWKQITSDHGFSKWQWVESRPSLGPRRSE